METMSVGRVAFGFSTFSRSYIQIMHATFLVNTHNCASSTIPFVEAKSSLSDFFLEPFCRHFVKSKTDECHLLSICYCFKNKTICSNRFTLLIEPDIAKRLTTCYEKAAENRLCLTNSKLRTAPLLND